MPTPEVTEYKGDLLIHNLCQNGTDSVHVMGVVKTDAKSHSANPPDKCLQEVERAKKRMYVEEFIEKRSHFSPFVASVDGFLGVDETATLNRIVSRLATKWRQPYSRTCGYVKSRISITLVRATNWCIRGSRVPTHRISVQLP